MKRFLADLAVYLRDFVRNLRARPSESPEVPGTPPEGRRAALLGGAVALFLTCYVVPLSSVLGPALMGVVGVVVWLLGAAFTFELCSLPPTTRARRLARTAAERTGLLWFERVCMLFALVAFIVGVGANAATTPLPLLAGLGFLAVAGGEYREREVEGTFPPLVLTPPDETELLDDQVYTGRTFAWSFEVADERVQGELTLRVSIPSYQQASADNPKFEHAANGDPRFTSWVIDFPSGEVARLATSLSGVADNRSMSSFLRIANVVAFAQAIKYALDLDSKNAEEYWRYPIETLFDECGDCEDTALLAAAVLRKMGQEVAMVVTVGETDGHAALGVGAPHGLPGAYLRGNDGKPYYYCETTATGWRVGEIPPDMADKAMKLLPVP